MFLTGARLRGLNKRGAWKPSVISVFFYCTNNRGRMATPQATWGGRACLRLIAVSKMALSKLNKESRPRAGRWRVPPGHDATEIRPVLVIGVSEAAFLAA